MDLAVPQLQRHFLMLYLEWLSRERSGAEDQTWVFGFVYHPNYTDRYMADLGSFLDWLDTYFIGKTTPEGYTIARYATIGEIADEFESWEAEHPGRSSFNYRRGDPYPYSYPTLVTKLEGSSFEGFINPDQDVVGYHFSTERGPTYLVWSINGDLFLDFSSILGGNIRVTDMGGNENLLDAARIPVGQEPLLIEP